MADDLITALTHATFVTCDDAGIYACTNCLPHTGCQTHYIDEHALQALHPFLPAAFRYSSAFLLRKSGAIALPADLVENLLHHYRAPLLIPDYGGHAHWVRDIREVTLSSTPQFIRLRVLAYVLNTTLPATATLPEETTPPVPGASYPATLRVTASWMEDTFPGWQERLTIGRALDYQKVALARFVCSIPSAAVDTELPDGDYNG